MKLSLSFKSLVSSTLTTSLLLGGLLSSAPARANGAPIVAVFMMESRGSRLKADEVVSLTDYLSTLLGEGGKLQIIPRDELVKRIRASKSKSHKECYDSSCQIELGRELAANYSISSAISRVGSKCLLTASVWDLSKATQIEAATEKSSCKADDLIDAVDKIAQSLISAIKRQASPEAASSSVQDSPSAPILNTKPLRGKYLALAKNRFKHDETIEIQWFATTGSKYDWVDVVPKGTKDDSAGDQLQYLNTKDGKFSVSGLSPGEYQARIYLDYNKKGYKVADRLAFQVKPQGPPPGVSVTSKHLGLTKRRFATDETIEVHYFATTGSKYDWVGVVPKGTPVNSAGDRYDYLTGRKGSYSVSDLPKGEWEARIYLDYNKKGYKIADRISFTVR